VTNPMSFCFLLTARTCRTRPELTWKLDSMLSFAIRIASRRPQDHRSQARASCIQRHRRLCHQRALILARASAHRVDTFCRFHGLGTLPGCYPRVTLDGPSRVSGTESKTGARRNLMSKNKLYATLIAGNRARVTALL
jgi:hypothetical protein